jgi:hypothetical protein
MNIKDRHQVDLFIFLLFLVITTGGLLIRGILLFNGNTYFILNSLGNIGGVIVGSYLFFWWRKESSFKKREIIIFSVGLGFTIYEFIQVVIPWQTYDLNDILGTLLGIIIASIINVLVIAVWKHFLRV